LANACAAFKPPNPAPTITTRGVASLVILLLLPHLYKIHRDGRRFQKFFAADSSGNLLPCMALLAHAIGR
jgi:hypothetical protein